MSIQLSGTPHSLAQMFADFMRDMAGDGNHEILYRTALLLSEAYEMGDVCLDLQALSNTPWLHHAGFMPHADTWRETLLQTSCVAKVGGNAPMILDGFALYLYRFWCDEQYVADAILKRMDAPMELDKACLEAGLARLFPKHHDNIHAQTKGENSAQNTSVDWQEIAAALVITQRFSVISGGPGTGKTTSLVKILALLLEQNPAMRIRLAAPTGKAAARMMASIRHAKAQLSMDDEIRQCIPEDASTLHRLLGFSPRGYRHGKDNPILLDCLVVDEASMIDLSMMARLLAALPEDAQLILLGDRDQLSSVDAGNVLGDITGHTSKSGHDIVYNKATTETLAKLTHTELSTLPTPNENTPRIAHSIALLRTSYRFNKHSAIGTLASSVNASDGKQAWQILQDAEHPSVCAYMQDELSQSLNQAVSRYATYLQQTEVNQALKQLDESRILCALRQGQWGVDGINQEIHRRLVEKHGLSGNKDAHGTPIIIRSNDYELQLFNGDVGLIWRNDDALQAVFANMDGSTRSFSVHLLPAHEPCWAMTVHQSQGSEFEHVLLILPPDEINHAVLSKALFYTAITRAKASFQVCGSKACIKLAINTHVSRNTGLAKRLGW